MRHPSLPLRERGLKCCCVTVHRNSDIVAPLAGAWIEIPDTEFLLILANSSLPLRERGLKYQKA